MNICLTPIIPANGSELDDEQIFSHIVSHREILFLFLFVSFCFFLLLTIIFFLYEEAQLHSTMKKKVFLSRLKDKGRDRFKEKQ